MSDDTSRTNGLGQNDDEHSVPGSMGHYSSYHQSPIIDGLVDLLNGLATGIPANIPTDVVFIIDEDGPADPLTIITTLKLLGISPSEAIEFLELFMVMTAPLVLIEDIVPNRYAANRADIGLYGQFDGNDELPYGDIHDTASTFGIPLPVRHVDEDPQEPITFTPVTRPGSIGDIAGRTTDRSRSAFHRLAEYRRQRRIEAMRTGALFPTNFGGNSLQHPHGDANRRTLNPFIGGSNEILRMGPLFAQLMSLGSLTPAIDADTTEAEDRANTVRAFVEGSRRGLEDAEGTTTSGHLRLVRGSDQGSMPPYIEDPNGTIDGPDAS